MADFFKAIEKKFEVIFSIVLLVGLYLVSLYNYLLFHTFAEIYSIVIAAVIFVLATNCKRYLENKYISFIGVAYLFVSFLDLLHTLSYKGMGVFTDYDYYANQLWIATRYMESLSLLVAFWFINNRSRFNEYAVFGLFALITASLVFSIFGLKIFPVCFVEGKGLTDFKKISEYIISAILLIDIVLLYRFRSYFTPKVYRYLLLSLVFTIGSELTFTFYVSNYGFSNLIGHYFKIFSFYLIYKALVEIGIKKPFAVIFKDLKDNQKTFERLSCIDPLTDLMNRRSFLEKLEVEQAQTEQNAADNALIIADIDYFKKINDNHGHDVGDEIIRGVADVFREHVRQQDSVCRWGGEEFLILLPGCNLDTAGKVAEKLRRLVANHVFVVRSNPIRCTLSFGVSRLVPGRPPLDSVRMADENLYRSKAAGRNRVTVEVDPVSIARPPGRSLANPEAACRD